jgi:general secretion pathway protein N
MAPAPRRDATQRGEPGVAKRNRRLALVGVLALAGFALATLPASLAGRVFQRVGLTATGFSGTIWSGVAGGVTWQGASLGEIRWRFRPLALLRARAAAHISMARPDGSVSTEAAAALDGTLEFTDLRLDLPIEFFAEIPTGMARGWHGTVDGELTQLRLVSGWPVTAAGTLHLSNVVMPQLGHDEIGSFEILIPDPRTAAQGSSDVRARVTDTSGTVAVDALLTLAPGRNFVLEGTVAARDGAPPGLVRSLQYLGPADQTGRRQFGVSGTF